MAGALARYLPQPEASPAAASDGGEAPTGSALAKYLPAKTSGVESFARGAAQGISLGFADELAGVVESAMSAKSYRQARDESRANYARAQEDNPITYGAGELGGGVATALLPVGVASMAARGLAGAAALGGAAGAGMSEADLTEGDVGGLARDTALGAGAGALTHGALTLAGKAARAVAPRARAAAEEYARSPTKDLLGGVGKSTLGRAALGAAGGAYSGDEDRIENALKGAALGVAIPAAHRAASKALKAAILAALERGGRKAAAQVAREAMAAETPVAEAVPGRLGSAQERAALVAGDEPLALAEYTPPGPGRALGGGGERLALPPVPEAEGRGIRLGPTEGGEPVATAAIPLPRWPRRVKGESVVPAERPGPGRPLPFEEAQAAAEAPTATAGAEGALVAPDAVAEFKDAVAKAKRLADSGDKMRSKLWLAAAEKRFKARARLGLAAAEEEAPVLAAPAANSEVGSGPGIVAEFRDAVAKAKRLADSGDKMRSKLWLAAAEKRFKAAVKGANPEERAALAAGDEPLAAMPSIAKISQSERRNIFNEVAKMEESVKPPAEPPISVGMQSKQAPATKKKGTPDRKPASPPKAKPAAEASAPQGLKLPAARAGDEELKVFADRVNQAADAIGPEGRFGRHKVFIADVQRALGVGPDQVPAFHAALLEAKRRGVLRLSRADLVAAMDEKKVADSEVKYHFLGDFMSDHFVDTER